MPPRPWSLPQILAREHAEDEEAELPPSRRPWSLQQAIAHEQAEDVEAEVPPSRPWSLRRLVRRARAEDAAVLFHDPFDGSLDLDATYLRLPGLETGAATALSADVEEVAGRAQMRAVPVNEAAYPFVADQAIEGDFEVVLGAATDDDWLAFGDMSVNFAILDSEDGSGAFIGYNGVIPNGDGTWFVWTSIPTTTGYTIEFPAVSDFPVGDIYWTRITRIGDQLTLEGWVTDPALGGEPYFAHSQTLPAPFDTGALSLGWGLYEPQKYKLTDFLVRSL